MPRLSLVATVSAFCAAVSAQGCPELPDEVGGIDFGSAVGPYPQDIPTGCSAYEILVARGTSEPNYANGGKFGVIVGDPVVSNTTKVLAGARGYPVQYPASSAVISGTRQGAADVVKRITAQSAACPAQTFVLVGYSQGAGVMHTAAENLPSSYYSKIKALVMFGDPNLRAGILGDRFPVALRSKVLQNCAKGDSTCDSGTCTYWHLTYIRPEWINRSVDFIVNAFKGTPLPPSTTIGLKKRAEPTAFVG